MFHTFIFALLLSFPISAQESQSNCEKIPKYLESLVGETEQVKNSKPYLQKLAALEKVDESIAVDFLFSIDLDDENAVQKRRAELESSIERNEWAINRPADIDASCFTSHPSVSEKEQQLVEALKGVAPLKVTFFTLPLEQRSVLLSRNKIANDFESKSDEVEQQLESGIRAKEAINDAKAKAKEAAEEAGSKAAKVLAEYQIDIETFRSRVADASVSWLNSLRKILDKYDVVSKKLDEVDKTLANNPKLSEVQLTIVYSKAKNQWRTLIDDGFIVYQMVTESSDLGKPDQPTKGFLKQVGAENAKVATELYQKAKDEIERFEAAKRARVESRFDDFHELLLRASKTRSELLSMIDESGISLFEANDDYLNDITREVFAIPFRFFGIVYQKYTNIQSNLSGGVLGFWRIIQNVFALVFVFFIPFLARYSSARLRRYLDSYRSNLLRKRKRSDTFSLSLAIWIQRLAPYSPWIVYGIFLKIIDRQLEGTFLEEMRIVIPILGYIVVYKIFRLLVSDTLSSLRRIARIDGEDTSKLINSTSKLVGFFFLFSYIILYLTKITVEEGLLYRQVSNLMWFFGIIICAYAANRWKRFIAPAAKELLPGKFGEFLNRKCTGRISIIFALPTLVALIANILWNLFWDWFSSLEFSKRFLAKLYRKKVESLAGEQPKSISSPLPHEYKTRFLGSDLTSMDLLVDANAKAFDAIAKEVSVWVENGEEDQSVAIYGEKGIGKTTLLDKIEAHFTELRVIRFDVTQTLYLEEDLHDLFAEKLGFAKGDSLKKDILAFNKIQDKNTIILVDDAQNLFLGKYGGFEAFRAYVDIVNMNTNKLFWCSVFNEYSWAYLKGVLGGTQYLRTEIFIESWSDEAIKNLVLSRHKDSGFNLSYDQIILASRSVSANSEAALEAEEQFFRLLWEQSNGNPRVALFLWVNCLSYRGGSTLKVSLPERPKSESLNKLTDNAWFVFASIARHENLTRAEAAATTNLEKAEVAQSIKIGLENRLLHRAEGGRYRLHFHYQYDLIRQLKMKNFIYGIN